MIEWSTRPQPHDNARNYPKKQNHAWSMMCQAPKFLKSKECILTSGAKQSTYFFRGALLLEHLSFAQGKA